MCSFEAETVSESGEEYDVIVVGAGIGGATCAALRGKGGALRYGATLTGAARRHHSTSEHS